VGCPSCGHEVDERAPSCRRCGAPFDLCDEPAPAPLDRAVDLDRRGSLAEPPPLQWSSGVVAGGAVLARDLALPEERRGAAAGPRPAPLDGAPARATPAPFPPLLAAEPSDGDDARDDAVEPVEEAADGPAAAPLGRRLAAAAIDALLVGVAAGVPLALVTRALPADGSRDQAVLPACIAFLAIVGFTYSWLGHALMSATIGKRWLGLRVAGPSGEPPGVERSAARAALATAGLAALGPGALVGLFTRRRKALHDLAAGTSVVVRDDR
jgi:uncharacterized RDD family membrane protein YckC